MSCSLDHVYGGHHSGLSAQCSDPLLQLNGDSLREQNDGEIWGWTRWILEVASKLCSRQAQCKLRSSLCGCLSLFHYWAKQIFLLTWNICLFHYIFFHVMYKCSTFYKPNFFYFGWSYPFLHSELLISHLSLSSWN